MIFRQFWLGSAFLSSLICPLGAQVLETPAPEAQGPALLRDMLQEKAAFWKQAPGLFMISNRTQAACTLTFASLVGTAEILRYDANTRLFGPIKDGKMAPGKGIRLGPDEYAVLQFDGKPGHADCKATLSIQLASSQTAIPIQIHGKGGERNRFFWKFQDPADEVKCGHMIHGIASDEPDAEGGNTSSLLIDWKVSIQPEG